jgi:4-hydroxybenzoate polyprenyltransferase
MAHTDIKSRGWVRRLPRPLRPYAILLRLDRPIGAWLLLLPGWWSLMMASHGFADMNPQDYRQFWLFALGAFVMRSAGCIVNDIWDRKLDRKVRRTRRRPIASGKIKVWQALILLAVLLGIGYLILNELSFSAILLGCLTLPLIVLYPLMKRITWWPQLFLGLTFNFGALIGWATVSMVLALPALLLYAAGIFWTLGYDTIYAYQDRADDRKAGVKSTALRFGDAGRIWVAIFYILALCFFLAAFLAADCSTFCLVLLLALPLHFGWQLWRWDMNDPASSLRIFKSNRDFGFLVLIAAALVRYKIP